jgi:putative PIN family toxin of toxin-antitoxin system
VRIVLDTNVLIAAYATRGRCHELLEHCARVHELVSSPVLLTELRQKLTRTLKFSSGVADALLSLLHPRLHLVDPPALDPPACRDPDDDWVLATAAAGSCRCIITGDRDLLVLHPFRSIAIVSPTDFDRFESLTQK